MKECSIKEAIRKWSLWAAIASLAIVLVLLICWAWGAFNLTDTEEYLEDLYETMYYGGTPNLFDFPFTVWAKIIMTFSAIAGTSISILLALLVGKFAKKAK